MTRPGESATLDLSAFIPLSVATTSSSGNSGNRASKGQSSGSGGMWTCSRCTYSNHGDLNYCEMCATKR
jgi:hypothetical protein